MTDINTPGDAMNAAIALLRYHGYGVREVAADWHPDRRDAFGITGRFTDINDGTPLGEFIGIATTNDELRLKADAFGQLDL